MIFTNLGSTLSFVFNDEFLTSPKPFIYGKRILALIAYEKLFFRAYQVNQVIQVTSQAV